MTSAESLASIRRHGLLSTRAILELCEVPGVEDDALRAEPRRESAVVAHPTHGDFQIRDQKPLNAKKLEACLVDMTVAEWLRVLDERVFFWPTKKRVMGLLAARAYRSDNHLVLEVDTELLLQRHAGRVELSPINSGSTAYAAAPRGRSTFRPLSEYPWEERRRKRGRSEAVAEVTVLGEVPDVMSLVTAAWIANSDQWTAIEPFSQA